MGSGLHGAPALSKVLIRAGPAATASHVITTTVRSAGRTLGLSKYKIDSVEKGALEIELTLFKLEESYKSDAIKSVRDIS